MSYAGTQLIADLQHVHSPSVFPFLPLGVALLTALGFEFVNGFHDTANAVATVIVLTSSGAVAFGILTLLPVEPVSHVGSDAGIAMVFALLLAASSFWLFSQLG